MICNSVITSQDRFSGIFYLIKLLFCIPPKYITKTSAITVRVVSLQDTDDFYNFDIDVVILYT